MAQHQKYSSMLNDAKKLFGGMLRARETTRSLSILMSLYVIPEFSERQNEKKREEEGQHWAPLHTSLRLQKAI